MYNRVFWGLRDSGHLVLQMYLQMEHCQVQTPKEDVEEIFQNALRTETV